MMERSGAKISRIIARNLSHLRKERGISLTGLAERAGISKSTLSSLEAGEANPTISTLWAIADALGVPFGLLVSEAGTESAEVTERGINVRLIEQSDAGPRIEVYLMRLEPGVKREATPHAPGVVERIFVINGRMLAGPLGSPNLLKAGEMFSFRADQPHVYVALDEPASALVTVEYPKGEVYTDHCTILRPIPETDEEWEDVFTLLRRMWERAAQGVPVFRLKLYGPEAVLAGAREKLEAQLKRLKRLNFSWPLKFFVAEEGAGISILVFAWPRGRFQLKFRPAKGSRTLKQALDILTLAHHRCLSGEVIKRLNDLVKSGSLILSTLAAEVLLRHGQPAVPSPARSLLGGETDFSELLRPGYASQSVALSQILHRHFNGAPVSAVYVGPETQLRMLLELYPALQVVAVDASPAAHLKEPGNGDIAQADFLTLSLSEQPPVVISVGASDHLNTSFFLQKAHDMLQNGGLLLVADEFLSPYASAAERNRELIRHYTTYMLATLVEIPEGVKRSLTSDEAELVKRLWCEIPLLAFEAEGGDVKAAIARARELSSRLSTLKIPVEMSHPLTAFYRFQMLELKALVARLDCVEHSTFSERFLALAESTGFSLREHYKVYATTGYGDMDGGVHVFAFKKEV
ncbi:MAG: helix-turn-helix domain-containing protein [Euryarchaeota archaeon]|nr:helix-turn-helix domain-containing protein [Euryarchaeota archaeon]